MTRPRSRRSRTRLSGEDRLVEWLKRQPETGGHLGDDAAFLPAGGPWAVTVDSQREGVHFATSISPSELARRSLAINLSDLAACGARPRWAFCTLAAPPDWNRRSFFRALLRAIRPHGLVLAGGDLSRSDRVEITITLMGEPISRSRFLTRADGRPGDRLFVGGTLGEAAMGLALAQCAEAEGRDRALPAAVLEAGFERAGRRARRRHLLPRPQLELGAWLARRRSRVAAIDISDGLEKDVARLCRASAVGCEIDLEQLPLAPRATDLASTMGLDAIELALRGGEDYVLLFSLESGIGRRNLGDLGAVEIGRLTDGPELVGVRDGRRHPLRGRGFDHLEATTEAS